MALFPLTPGRLPRCLRYFAQVTSSGPPLLALFIAVSPAAAQVLSNRIHFNGQNLFLNGLNLAWGQYPGGGASFANDIGPNPSTPNINHFTDVFTQMEANGANTMRLWLHTTGANTPTWSGSVVTGPGTDTITDLETILDLAWDHHVGMVLCLWSFDMLRISNGTTITDRARGILTNASLRQAYITNALIPMVQALQGHPAIICWEIFNEPEGMSNEFGWEFNYHVPMADIQAFINQCAGAIHRTDPTAKVSNGSWSFYAATDVGAGNYNFYTDTRLIAAGGDPDGILDFYMVHYYDWAGTGRSPFQHPYSYWQLDKPLVVAEFFADCNNCTPGPYETLYQNGYAGALAWSWTDSSHSLMLGHIGALSNAHPSDVLIVPQVGFPNVSITVPANGTTFPAGSTVSIVANASDTNGSITSVEFYRGATKLGEDLTDPYEYSWTNPPVGHYFLTARATDNETNATTSAAVSIQVGIAPTVTLTTPTDGAAFGAGVTVAMSANASDADGSVTTVEFFQNGQKLGEDVSDPFELSWTNPPAGVYTLTAKATDDTGMTTTSSGVGITVGTPLPPSRLEAEDAVVTGSVFIGFDGAASGGAYLNMAGNAAGDTITWSVDNVPAAGTYDMTIGFNLAYDSPKTQNLTVNGAPRPAIQFAAAQDVWLELTVPVPLSAGNNQVQIIASWGYIYFDYIEFDFPLPNTAPTLTPIANQTINPGATLVLTNTATDSEAPPQTLTFSLLNGPSNATVNASSGVFTWRPWISQADSVNPISVTVTDNGSPSLTATNAFTVTVNPASPPVVDSVQITGGQVNLMVQGIEGPDYTLLTSTNLMDWSMLMTSNSPTLPLLLVDPNPPLDTVRFYEIRLGP